MQRSGGGGGGVEIERKCVREREGGRGGGVHGDAGVLGKTERKTVRERHIQRHAKTQTDEDGLTLMTNSQNQSQGL